MSNRNTVQIRLTSLLCLVSITIFLLLFYTVYNRFLLGINEADITCGQDMGSIPYTVVDVQEIINNNSTLYNITFESVVKEAPPIKTSMTTVPSGLTLDSEYMVDWVHVFAVYDKFTKHKDLISLQYTGVEITEQAVNKAMGEVKSALVADFADVSKPIAKWAALAVFALNFIVCFMLAKLASNTADKWASEDVWSKISTQFNETYEEAMADGYYGIDTSIFDSSDLPTPTVPFRFWADDDEYKKLLEQRKIRVDASVIADHKRNDMAMDVAVAKRKAANAKGIIPDIDIDIDINSAVPKTEKPVVMEEVTRIRRVRNSNVIQRQAPAGLPKSSLNNVRRGGTVKKENSVGFKVNNNNIDDIDIF